MSLELKIETLTATLARNNELMEQLVATRQEGLAKIEALSDTKGGAEDAAAAAEKPARRTRATKAEPAPAAKEEPKKVKASKHLPKLDDESIRAYMGEWMGTFKTKEDRQPHVEFIKSVQEYFGTATLVGDTGIPLDDRKQAMFFIARHREGLPVNFDADYDFDGEPTQGGAEETDAAAEDDEYSFG